MLTRCNNKTAELSQKRPHDAPNTWVPWNVLRVLTTHPATFPEICNGLLFRSILRTCVQKLKFVALPVPEKIGSTQKNLGSSWIGPRSIFSQNFKGLLFGWTLRIYLPKLKFIALSIPEIIGGTQIQFKSNLPQFSPCSPGSRWMAFGLRRAKVLG